MLRDPMDGDGVQLHLVGQACAEQPQDGEEDKEIYRQGEEEQGQLTEISAVIHYWFSSGWYRNLIKMSAMLMVKMEIRNDSAAPIPWLPQGKELR
jgi:hypothetical protein